MEPPVVHIKCKSKRKNAPKAPKLDLLEAQGDNGTFGIDQLDTLGWKSIDFPMDDTINGDNAGGFTMLEEIDGVDVFYDEENGGKSFKFQKTDKKSADPPPKPTATETEKPKKIYKLPDTPIDLPDIDMSAWDHFKLHPDLLKGLQLLKFQTPTEIQAKVLPHAVHSDQDIIGAAETGSGKTLAFGLPILHKTLMDKETVDEEHKGIPALILAPTRELAVQIKDHMVAVSKFTTIQIVAVLGGMSMEKQKRLLARKPDIIIATPGRFWQWVSEEDTNGYLTKLHETVKYLVVDEADRMIERGHFADLDKIFMKLHLPVMTREWDESFNVIEVEGSKKTAEDCAINRQTFVFSATINFDTSKNSHKRRNMEKDSKEESLDALIKRIPFKKSEEPLVLDLTTSSLVARSLTETRVECLNSEKDLYLYYFLLKYPGRTLVFVNTIDCIKRLMEILRILNVPAYGLHATMQQRQRLKNLDRFKAKPNCVLVASDVASRGLDIPVIEHVIHYQLPKTSELYVHRSGRTARAHKDGLSLMICSPEEVKSYRMICSVLEKSSGVPLFDVDRGILRTLSQRIELAKEIAKLSQTKKKKSDSNAWLKKVAEEMDIDVDEGLLSDDDDTLSAKQKQHINQLKSKLVGLLGKPVLPTGTGSSYITGKSSQTVELLLQNLQKNMTLPTLKDSSAIEDAQRRPNKRRK